MKELILCGHTGSINHGCEAIIKGTATLLKKQNIVPVLATKAADQDMAFGADEFADLVEYEGLNGKTLKLLIGRVVNKLTNPPVGTEYFHGKKVWQRLKGNVAINVGGDTYCYDVPRSSLALNWFTQKNGIPNILWACSIEDIAITPKIKADLQRYTQIMPRESLTYDNLVNAGIAEDKLTACVDPAFVLSRQVVDIKEAFFKKGVVGINLSPLVVGQGNPKMVMQNYQNMISEILQNTAYNICFVPHVYASHIPQDLIPLRQLQAKYAHTGRTMLVEKEYNCKQLKYIISRCALFVCARTHASIAAYSTNVPTLVVGYSVKSLGIAKDIFGTHDNYVIPTQSLSKAGQLTDGFKWLNKNKAKIKKHLTHTMPAYKQQAWQAGQVLAKYAYEE